MKLADLPEIGSALQSGVFCDVLMHAKQPCALLLLPYETPDAESSRLNWHEATEWASKRGYMLPTPPMAALLAHNLAHLFKKDFYWTSAALHENPAYAWQQSFLGMHGGGAMAAPKRHLGRARAVQLVPLSA